MTQPSIPGNGIGIPRMPYGFDGSDWIALLVDALGRLQIDAVIDSLPGDLATETTLAAIEILIGAVTNPSSGTMNKQLLQLVTRMGAVVDPGVGTLLYQLDEIDDAIGSIDGGDAGTLLAYLLEIQSRLGDETSPSAGTLAKLLTDVLTSLQVIDGFADAQNLLFGYYDRWAEEEHDYDASTGTNTFDFTAVPGGEIWVLLGVSGRNDSRGCRIFYSLIPSSIAYCILDETTTVAGQQAYWSGQLVLKEGDQLQVIFYSVVLHDNLYCAARGYKMKIA